MTERWQVAGTAAEAYERYLVPAFFGPFADRLIELATPRPTDRTLDVACGTGAVARRIAPLVGSVTGLDLNEGMLAVARAAEPAVDWLAGDACALPIPDASFDLVLCQQGVQFFPDRTAGLREMRRVLAPGGRLAISVWRAAEHNPGWLRLAEALDRHAGAAGAMMRAPFSLSDGAELRELVEGAGFEDVSMRIRIVPVRFPSAGDLLSRQEVASPLAEPLSALPPESRDALGRDFAAALLPYTDDDGVCFPMQTHIITASA
jgi:SAM-dependent methyltransferase